MTPAQIDIHMKRERVNCLQRSINAAKRAHEKHTHLERKLVLEKAELVALEAKEIPSAAGNNCATSEGQRAATSPAGYAGRGFLREAI